MNNIYLLKNTEAIFNALYGTEAYYYRKVCRWYSKTFSTPLNDVFSMPYEEVLLHYYESICDQTSYNEILRLAKEILPELAEEKDKEDAEFIKQLKAMEASKQKQSFNKPLPAKTPPPPTKAEEMPEVFKTFDVEEP